jgi:methylmalonyl-CoA carboxyltransferase 1.3S subunit
MGMGRAKVKLQIEFGGDTYDVDVDIIEQDPAAPPPGYIPPLPARRPGSRSSRLKHPLQAQAAEDDRTCRSPLRGLVARVNVKPGQRVQAGDIVVVLEAMKMETNLAATRACTVKSVQVAPGAGVQIGQVLLEFE